MKGLLYKSVAFGALAALLYSSVIGCRKASERANDGAPKFAFVTNGVASFWTVAAAGAKKAGEEFGAEVTIVMPEGLTDQTRKLEDLITRGVDGVAVSPINPDNQTDILNKVAAAMHLVTHDSDAPKSNRVAYVGMDNYEAGRMCGELVREALPEGGSVMLFIGRLDQDNAQYRRQGCIDAIMGRDSDRKRRDPPGAELTSEDGKYTILGTLTDQFDRAKAKANVEDTLTRNPDVAAMVGLFVYNPPAILEALDRAGKLDSVKVIGFDEDNETLQAIQDGTVVGTVVQDPYLYGYESIRLLADLTSGDDIAADDGYIDVPPRLIHKDNLKEFWDTLKQRLADAD